METANTQAEPLPTPADTVADEELADYVKEHRQSLPPLPDRVPVPELFRGWSDEVFEKQEAKIAAAAERRRRQELVSRASALVTSAGQRYRNCTLQNFERITPAQYKAVAALADYVASDTAENVILFGPVGTGKDHLAFALCREAIRAGNTVRWINGQQWFSNLRDAMDTDKSEASLIYELATPDVLCLSDPLPPVGTLTQYQATMLYRLIDARYAKSLPTICTVNISSDHEADERMGAATWDRFCHGAWKIHCNWPSYRKPAREV